MEIQINYHKISEFIHLKNTFAEVLIWTIKQIKLDVKSIDIIFTTDSFIRQLHKRYFDLDTKTDVITFNLDKNEIEGEIYISIDRAKVQSKEYNVNTELELCRLIIHGCLHLAGFSDENKDQQRIMKIEEDKLVEEVNNIFIHKLNVEVN